MADTTIDLVAHHSSFRFPSIHLAAVARVGLQTRHVIMIAGSPPLDDGDVFEAKHAPWRAVGRVWVGDSQAVETWTCLGASSQSWDPAALGCDLSC